MSRRTGGPPERMERIAIPDSRSHVEAILAEQDAAALEAVLAAAEPGVAAAAICAAPTLERKTELLWAMEDRHRRETVELLPPPLLAALVQNLEEDNRYLLGDLSLEQFRALLDLCSPERKFYWIATALSFADARANALPFFLPTRELAEILLTRQGFEEHLRALGDYPLEQAGLPEDALTDPAQALVDLFGPENLLRHFPVRDPALEQVLRMFLESDPDRYVELVREGLRQADYRENHPGEWEMLAEEPVLLGPADALWRVPSVEPPDAGGPARDEAASEPAAGPALALVPLGAPRLQRLVALLPEAERARLREEVQALAIRQAVAEGGSFHLADLERVARSTEAYVLLGLEAEGADTPGRQAALIARRPVRKIAQSGARMVERLRQVALRLAPMEMVLPPAWRALVRSLTRPRLTVGPEGDPRLLLLPAEGLPETVDLREAAARLHEVASWTDLARALGLERTAKALRAAASFEALLEDLALAGVLYRRLEPGLAEPGDRERFRRRYRRRGVGPLLPEARAGLRQALGALPGVDLERAVALLERALERVADREA